MKQMSFLLLVVMVVPLASAQQSLSELTAAQRRSLTILLSREPDLRSMLEGEFDQEILRGAREEWGFGTGFRPYYQRGDFNRDGKMDFAVVVTNVRSGVYQALVFNQVRGLTYALAHRTTVGTVGDASFIHFARGKLSFGTMETDHCVEFVPRRGRYAERNCGL